MIASLGGIAALIVAIVWIPVAFFLAVVFLNLFRVLESAKMMIDDLRKETVPLLSEVTTTVSSVNKELDRADGILESAGNIARSAERVSAVVEQTVSSPLIKIAAFGAGAARAVRRLRKKKES